MARLPRLYAPGCTHHVIHRVQDEQNCFLHDADSCHYLERLDDARKKYKVDVHAYALMPNHVRLLVTPSSEDGVSRMMQSVGRCYVAYFNRNYEREGSLWETRYRSTLVGSKEYLLAVSKHIELAPVRAGLVTNPLDYLWSSHRYNARGRVDGVISPHRIYQALAGDDKARQAAYRAEFRGKMPQELIDEIRDATNKAWALGDRAFLRKVQKATGRVAGPRQWGGDRKSAEFRLR